MHALYIPSSITGLVAGEFPAFTAIQSWALIVCAAAVIVVLVAEFAANGADILGEVRAERDYDDRIKTPYPPRPASTPRTAPAGKPSPGRPNDGGRR